MRHTRDQFAKDLLELLLTPYGRAEQDAVIPGTDPQRADLRFTPRVALPALLGTLARMTEAPCLLEHFSEAPAEEALHACMRKVLTWRHQRAKRGARGDVLAWALCAGRPDRALAALDLRATPRWPRGVYGAGWPLRVVVISELPRTDDTVYLRLLGNDAARELALDDLSAAGGRLPSLDDVMALLVQYLSTDPTPPEDAMAVDLSKYHAWKEQLLAEGRVEGEARGRAEGEARGRLIGLIEGRLRRALLDDELARTEKRVARDGVDTVTQRARTLDDHDLARWLAGKRIRAS